MKKYGLVGKKLDYSYSKHIHEFLIDKYDLKATYDLIETNKLNKEELLKYDGLNITIPYKEAVISFLDEHTTFLACNTIVNDSDYLKGYNTDIDGFDYLVKQLEIDNIKSIIILGSGASSKLVQEYFKDKDVKVISRKDTIYNYNKLKTMSADLLVNATPVGMNEFKSPVESITNFKAVIDLNYNPNNSKLKMQCLKAGIQFVGGITMLVRQAIKAFEIWHNIKVSYAIEKEITLKTLLETNNKIVLIGMPLSGKTTLINKYKGVDLDAYIEKSAQTTIPKLIENNTFRQIESSCLKDLVDNGVKLLACGGGIVENYQNIELLKDYLIVYLKEELNIIKIRYYDNERPLLKDISDIDVLYQKRAFKYRNYANVTLSYDECEEMLQNIKN